MDSRFLLRGLVVGVIYNLTHVGKAKIRFKIPSPKGFDKIHDEIRTCQHTGYDRELA